MILRTSARSVLACVLLVGCSAGPPTPPTGDTGNGTQDTGSNVDDVTADDTSATDDTGTSTDDTGLPPDDTGTDPTDSGIDIDATTATDSGAPAIDVPTPLGDTGIYVPDTGVDAGPLPPVVNVIQTGAPAGAPTQFGGTPASTAAITVVYPAPDTIIPPNLQSFEVHFLPAAGDTLFDIAFASSISTIHVYTPCTSVGGGCVASLDAPTISDIARAAAPDGGVQLTVRGIVSSGGTVAHSASQALNITPNALVGGLYYWSAAAGNIMRYEFGLPDAHAETWMSGGSVFTCLGCHVISRDGTRAAIGQGIPAPSQMNTYDVTSRAPLLATAIPANFATWSPDDTRLLTSDGAHLSLYDGSGAAAPGLAPATVGSMPDWSADGNHVVISRPASVPLFFGTPGQSGAADLQILPWASGAFGAATTLVHSAGEDNYYPAYSPDGRWVLFNRSAVDSYNAIDAHLYVVPSDGSVAPVSLTAADGTGDLGNSWPKWAPFADTYASEPLMWFTFTSRRDYGLRLQQQSVAADSRVTQLWMAAFRPSRVGTPQLTGPAFWLPFQSLTEGNHIAQWTQTIRRPSCTTDADCPAGQGCKTENGQGVCVATH